MAAWDAEEVTKEASSRLSSDETCSGGGDKGVGGGGMPRDGVCEGAI